MVRQLFPSERVQLGVPREAGRPAVSLAGGFRTIYSDPAHTNLAVITDQGGAPIDQSRLQIDDLSRLPLFYGPDGVDVLYDDAGNTYYPVAGPEGQKGDTGAQGPTGPPGPPGNAQILDTVFSFAIPSATWTINHNLGHTPSVTLYGDDGAEIVGKIVSNDANTTVVAYQFPVSGRASFV